MKPISLCVFASLRAIRRVTTPSVSPKAKPTVAIIATLLSATAAFAQETATPDRLKATFRDPSRPGTLKVNLIHGGIIVKGYEGREVTVEAVTRHSPPGGAEDTAARGMRRIYDRSTGLTVEEENNVMEISARSMGRRVDLSIQVPLKTSLQLRTVNGGEILVENVDGEIEANNVNGKVTLTNISGTAVAHALNGSLTAVFRRVDPGKPMSFSSLNGKIDVTLPASTKADLHLRTENGSIYSDFDMALESSTPKVEEAKPDSGRGKYRIGTEAGVRAKVNGGGQSIAIKNMNGSIYIRKGQ